MEGPLPSEEEDPPGVDQAMNQGGGRDLSGPAISEAIEDSRDCGEDDVKPRNREVTPPERHRQKRRTRVVDVGKPEDQRSQDERGRGTSRHRALEEILKNAAKEHLFRQSRQQKDGQGGYRPFVKRQDPMGRLREAQGDTDGDREESEKDCEENRRLTEVGASQVGRQSRAGQAPDRQEEQKSETECAERNYVERSARRRGDPREQIQLQGHPEQEDGQREPNGQPGPVGPAACVPGDERPGGSGIEKKQDDVSPSELMCGGAVRCGKSEDRRGYDQASRASRDGARQSEDKGRIRQRKVEGEDKTN